MIYFSYSVYLHSKRHDHVQPDVRTRLTRVVSGRAPVSTRVFGSNRLDG